MVTVAVRVVTDPAVSGGGPATHQAIAPTNHVATTTALARRIPRELKPPLAAPRDSGFRGRCGGSAWLTAGSRRRRRIPSSNQKVSLLLN